MKCCDSVYAWIVLILSALWLIGSVWPTFGNWTIRVPWFPLIIFFAALGCVSGSCKKK